LLHARSLFLAFLAFLLFPAAVWCQHGKSSLDFEYRTGWLTAADHTPNVVNPSLGNGDGHGQAQFIRLLYQHDLATFLDRSFILSAAGGLSQGFGSFSSPAFTLQYSGTFVHANLDLGFDLSPIGLALGGWIDIPISQTLTQSLTNGTSRNGSVYPLWPVGLRLEAGYSDRIIESLPITPSLFAEFDFSAYRQPNIEPRQASSAGLALRWSFGSEPSPTPVDTTPPVVTATQPILAAHVAFTYRSQPVSAHQFVPIESHDTLFRQYVMMPSRLSTSFRKLSPNDASHITIDSLARLSEVDMVNELPNVIGMRLKADSTLVVTLRSNDIASAQRLAEYLERTFGIPATHLRTVAGASDGIELLPSRPSLLAPVITQWIERSYDIDEIGIDHSVDASAGIRDWSITIEQLGSPSRILTEHTNHTITLSQIHPSNASPFITILRASDSSGQEAIASDTLHLAVTNPSGRHAGTTSRYILLADSAQASIIDRMLEKIRAGEATSSITIDYYSDEPGFPAWLRKKVAEAGIHGNEITHTLPPQDSLGSRAIITITQ
jgi:hypothetical protein